MEPDEVEPDEVEPGEVEPGELTSASLSVYDSALSPPLHSRDCAFYKTLARYS